jgi:hypothetical protein
MSRHAFRPILLAAITLALAASSLSAQATQAELWRIGLKSAGPLKVGTALDKLPVRLHEPLERTVQDPRGHCFYASPESTPDLHLMILGEHLVRFDVFQPGIATVEGVQVGDPIEKLKRTYGKRLSSAPNFYDERELDYRIQSADGRYAIRFQTGEGKVSAILAGDAKAVAYVEGCL